MRLQDHYILGGNTMNELWNSFGDVITNILPRSPFSGFIQSIGNLPFLGWLNWFVPVEQLVNIFGAWLAAVALFYLYQIVLRWVKVIQG